MCRSSSCHSCLTSPLVGALLLGCGRTPIEPLTGRDEGDRDLCGDREHELLCNSEGARFAAVVLHYDRTLAGDIPPPGGAFSDPEAALGPPDFSFSTPNTAVSTGNGGVLEVAFESCFLTNGGSPEPDLFIYEAGPLLETVAVSLRPAKGTNLGLDPEPDGYVRVGDITGSGSIDIDDALPGFAECDLRFDALRIEDDPNMGGWFSEATGADIDAVEILERVHPDVE